MEIEVVYFKMLKNCSEIIFVYFVSTCAIEDGQTKSIRQKSSSYVIATADVVFKDDAHFEKKAALMHLLKTHDEMKVYEHNIFASKAMINLVDVDITQPWNDVLQILANKWARRFLFLENDPMVYFVFR